MKTPTTPSGYAAPNENQRGRGLAPISSDKRGSPDGRPSEIGACPRFRIRRQAPISPHRIGKTQRYSGEIGASLLETLRAGGAVEVGAGAYGGGEDDERVAGRNVA